MQNQMCDMMMEIEKERMMCEAQIENKTTGRYVGIWGFLNFHPYSFLGFFPPSFPHM